MIEDKMKALAQVYSNATSAKEKISALLDICAETRQYDIEEAMVLAVRAFTEATEENYQLGIGRSIYAMGSCYWQKGEYTLASEKLSEAIMLAVSIKDSKLEAKSKNILGNVYRELGNVNSALKNYLNALELFEQIKDEHNSGVVMKNIALLHFDLYDYDAALEYASRSVIILEKYENKYRMFSIYHTLGNIYFKKEDYSNALTYFYKSMELTEPNTNTHALAMSGLGKVYVKLGDFTKANNYLSTSGRASAKHGFIESEIISEFYLGLILLNDNELPQALQKLLHALQISDEHGRKHDAMSVHEYLAKCYEGLNDLPNAYKQLKLYEQKKEEIFQQDAINKLKNMQVRHEIEVAHKEREVAERTAMLKQQFLANMSHEIRTPMNAIIGLTRLLIEKNHLPEQERYLSAIKTSADNLLVIINDILDVSKLEAGKVIIEKIPFSIRDLIISTHEMLRIKTMAKPIEFVYEIEKSIPDVLIGDPTRIAQIIINLAGNAIKFTDNGTVGIRVLTRKLYENYIKLKFEVSDTGVGISEQYVNQLFEKFTQAGTDTARKYGGTGLGLSITKQLVQLMNGNISVKSKEGVGSVFSVELEFEISNTQALNNENNDAPQLITQQAASLNNKKILLVEDNEFNQMLAIDTLKELNASLQIDTAVNGKQACDKAAQQLYDVILMDIQMPVLNGVEATQWIRSQLPEPYNMVQIIAMTANVMQQDIDHYKQIGMNGYVSKPFTVQNLLHQIVASIGQNKSPVIYQVEKEQQPIVGEIVDKEMSSLINLNFLIEFTKGDIAKQKKYLNMLLSNTPQLLKQAEDAIVQQDRARLKVSVHSLKNQLKYIGVPEQQSGVYALEQAAENTEFNFIELNSKVAQLIQVSNSALAQVEQIVGNL
jgi:signal transduction histidine kinase/DNA-binding response OmpR family regulator/Flp pilus assembly protein TadD